VPIVLNQRTWHDDPKYLDREGVIYHYPSQYRSRIRDFDRFIYYRPAAGATPEEASTYIGHGVLGLSFEDFARPNHSYVNVAWYQRFTHPVPLREGIVFLETEAQTKPQFQSSARPLRDTAYYRILAYGGVSADGEFRPSQTAESVLFSEYSPLIIEAPKDRFREIAVVPEGTGYVPSGKALPSVFESAALQERARKDHNATLELIRQAASKLGGTCWYNNNVDLLVQCGNRRMLIEAKSLTDPNQSVDRMRYGMGQLFDYRVRYKAELQGAEPVLAFGNAPERSTSWISNILHENGIAFVAREQGRIVPLNPSAENLPICVQGC